MIRILSNNSFPKEMVFSQALAESLLNSSASLTQLSNAEAILLLTDFSSSRVNQSTSFYTSGILAINYDDALAWISSHRATFRAKDGFKNQSISYKGTNDRHDHISRLASFVKCADELEGLLLTLSVPKHPKFVFTDRDDSPMHPALMDFRNWKPLCFESLVRIASAMSICCSVFLREGQQVLWVCDNDDIVANEVMKEATMNLVARHIIEACERAVTFSLMTPSDVRGSTAQAVEDLLAVPDIAAGGIGNTINLYDAEYGDQQTELWLPTPGCTSEKDRLVSQWFGQHSGRLLKRILSFDTKRYIALAHYISNVYQAP